MAVDKNKYSSIKPYQSTLTRRSALKWLGAISVTATFPALIGCQSSSKNLNTSKGHWPEQSFSPINAKGYGKDPNLIIAPKNVWPRILTTKQFTLVAVLADIIVPREGDVPSASEVNVPDVVNEWVSAPYSGQQADREYVLNLLTWLDDESILRFNALFIDVSEAKQLMIIDDIAYNKADLSAKFTKPMLAFARMRQLVLAAFFCSPEGTKDIGYLGNVPIVGDYPGPTQEAVQHLNQALDKLGLSL